MKKFRIHPVYAVADSDSRVPLLEIVLYCKTNVIHELFSSPNLSKHNAVLIFRIKHGHRGSPSLYHLHFLTTSHFILAQVRTKYLLSIALTNDATESWRGSLLVTTDMNEHNKLCAPFSLPLNVRYKVNEEKNKYKSHFFSRYSPIETEEKSTPIDVLVHAHSKSTID